MQQKSMRQALNEALRQEMRRDPSIIVIGEDVPGGAAFSRERLRCHALEQCTGRSYTRMISA